MYRPDGWPRPSFAEISTAMATLAQRMLVKYLHDAGGWPAIEVRADGQHRLYDETRDALQHQHAQTIDRQNQVAAQLQAQYDVTLRTAARYRAALVRYGRHRATCDQLVSPERPCSCGFSAVIASGMEV